MIEVDKLRVLIPHWIEHNEEHADEFRRWAETAGQTATDLLAAAEAMQQVNRRLANALEKLGGALTPPHMH
jgi:DNA-binding NtrC family response regulator